MKYDSTEDTLEHIRVVKNYAAAFCKKLENQVSEHDRSKLLSPEKESFDKFTPLLKELKYGSLEYKKSLDGLGAALRHHYENNRHHPEHHKNGLMDMNLVDIIEMLCDWKAATERMRNGNIRDSITINARRYGIGDELLRILRNTADALWPEEG